MSKERLLYIIITILVILNLILVGSMWMKSNKAKHLSNPDAHLKQHFSFTDEQFANFQVKKADHHKRIVPLFKSIRETNEQYYNVLSTQENKDSLWTSIQGLEKQIYEANLRHFRDIKEICTKDQYPALEKFIDQLLYKTDKRPGKK